MPLISVGVSGGLNLAVHPSKIADNELSAAFNVVYEPNSGVLRTREGISPLGDHLPDPIEILFPFTRKVGESWLMCVSGRKLYRMNIPNQTIVTADGETLVDSDGNTIVTGGDGELEWIEVSALESNRPSFLAFNGKLLVADGGAGILSWDGTTSARIANSPKATAIFEIKNRVVANSTADGELDSVYMSAAENESEWDVTKGALGIRAGYGDGMAVNGFASVKNTLIVSKTAETDGLTTQKKLFYVQIGDDSAPKSADTLSNVNAAIGPHAIVGYQQDVHYVDAEGFESLNTTDAYGDIANDPAAGGKINRAVSEIVHGYDSATMCLLPRQAALYMFFESSSRVFVHSLLTKAFTELDFPTKINHAADYGERTFFAGGDGQLYFYNTVGFDSVGGEQYPITTVVRSKLFEAPARALLERVWLRADFLMSGRISIEAYTGNASGRKILGTFDFIASADGSKELYSATGQLSEANGALFGEPEKRIDARSRLSFFGLMLQARCLDGGRIVLNGIDAQIRVVGR